jgi:hypothetical protein
VNEIEGNERDENTTRIDRSHRFLDDVIVGKYGDTGTASTICNMDIGGLFGMIDNITGFITNTTKQATMWSFEFSFL